MAVHYIKHPQYNVTSSGLPMYEFQIESESDVNSLPTMTDKKAYPECCCAGSVAYTADLNVAYTLSASGTWAKATE